MIRQITRVLTFAAAIAFVPATLHAESPTSEADKFDLGEILVHHLMDAPIFEWNVCVPGNLKIGEYPLCGKKVYEGSEAFEKDPFRRYVFEDKDGKYKWEGGLPMHITRRVMMMFIVVALMLVIFIAGARAIARNPLATKGRYKNSIEAMVQFVRNDIAEPNMHHHSAGFQPYLLTAFFFILFSNMLGLFPPFGELLDMALHGVHPHHGTTASAVTAVWPGITVTGDVAVTMVLAIMTTIQIWITGFRYQGIQFIWTAVPNGVPIWLYPLLWPLEFVISPLSKGFALTIRLLANMTAGHVIIIVLLGFIMQFKNYWLGFVSVPGAGMIYMLEILVAFLQAFVFTLLSALFIGASMHRH